jgi:hypothetical protein
MRTENTQSAKKESQALFRRFQYPGRSFQNAIVLMKNQKIQIPSLNKDGICGSVPWKIPNQITVIKI